MTPAPVAYIRRSVSRRNDPGDVSRQFQTEKVRELANGDGATLAIIDQDWGRSAAGDKTDKRLAFLELLASVERGEVSTLYAYASDRLARSVRWAAQLLDACEAAGTTIVTGEGRFAPSDDMARQMFHFQAMQNEGALRQMEKKARSSVEARAARGDRLGRAPYGYRMARDADGRVIHVLEPSQPIAPILDAFREAGSFGGAARLLNERGVKPQLGSKWSSNIVGKIVRREAPGLAPAHRGKKRIAPKGTHIFTQLLRCHCGQMLTGRFSTHATKYGEYGPYVSYQCFRGRYDAAHHRPYMIAERIILDWAREEVARLRPPVDVVKLADRDKQRRAEIEVERERLGWAVVDGHLGREQAKARADALEQELSRLGEHEEMAEVVAVEWDWAPKDLNAVLRAIWECVELGPDMRPVRAKWRRPEWRA